MSFLVRPRQQRDGMSSVDGPLIPSRPPASGRGLVAATGDNALRHSAVWACLRLRNDLMSTFPLDCFRRVGDIQVEVPKPPVLVEPGGSHWDYVDWMYASGFDLDRCGNTIGLITEKDGNGMPARIDLAPISECSVIQRRDDPHIRYRVWGKEYPAEKVWHERQYPVAGLAVGLSPLAYAAWTISEGLSMQQFALDWFGGGAVPKARLRNTKKTVGGKDAGDIKERFNASVANGDLFVHGNDWEYDFMQAETAGMEWLEGRRATLPDIARYLGCPADLIDAAVSGGGQITYASITQRNLQFLIMNLNPLVVRREKNLSKLLSRPRFVKLNTDALLRLDPETREKVIRSQVDNRRLTNTEARALLNLPPLTAEQIAEFNTIYGPPKTSTPTPAVRGGEPWWEQVSPMSAAPYQHPDLSETGSPL